MHNREALEAIVAWLDREGRGHATVQYRLRDWLLSRQRYWGCPIPIVYCPTCGIVPVPEDQLPVELPDVEDYKPKGRSPLAAAEDWVHTTCPTLRRAGARARRTRWTRSSTRPGTSCATATRTTTRRRGTARAVDRWMPVDQYIGGVEHAILHLLYARFFCKALTDLGHLDVQEPFARLFTQGMITRDGAKMSKSQGQRRLAAGDRRALRRRHRALLHPVHRPARPGRRLARHRRRGHAPLPRRGCGGCAPRPPRRCPTSRRPSAGEGNADDERILRKAHWAIDKVGARPRRRALRVQHRDRRGHGAAERARRREARRRRRPGAVRFALAIGGVADLPVRAARRRRRLLPADRAARVGGAVARGRRGVARAGHVRARRPGQRQGPRPRAGARRRRRRTSCSRWRAAARTCRRTSTAREVVKEIVVPGKLVNFVVRGERARRGRRRRARRRRPRRRRREAVGAAARRARRAWSWRRARRRDGGRLRAARGSAGGIDDRAAARPRPRRGQPVRRRRDPDRARASCATALVVRACDGLDRGRRRRTGRCRRSRWRCGRASAWSGLGLRRRRPTASSRAAARAADAVAALLGD